MMDPTDFPVVERVFVPEPSGLALLTIILLLAAAAVAAFFAGRAYQDRKIKQQREKALGIIFDEIRKKLDSALLASQGSIISGAEALVREIKSRVGEVALFGSDFGSKVKAIESAVNLSSPAKPAAGGGDKKPEAGGSASQATASAHITIVTPGGSGSGGGEKAEDPYQRTRNALGAFADYWAKADRKARIGQMSKVAEQLSKTSPPPPPPLPPPTYQKEVRDQDGGKWLLGLWPISNSSKKH
jgi:hypothetical protein